MSQYQRIFNRTLKREEGGDLIGRLETVAGQNKDTDLIFLHSPRFQEAAQNRAGGGTRGLDEKPRIASSRKKSRSRLLHSDDRTTGLRRRGHYLPNPHRPLTCNAVCDGGLCFDLRYAHRLHTKPREAPRNSQPAPRISSASGRSLPPPATHQNQCAGRSRCCRNRAGQ